MYTYLTLAENGFSSDQVKMYSGAFFLTVALVYYYALLPVTGEILDSTSSSSTAAASVKSSKSNIMAWIVLCFFVTFLFVVRRALRNRASK